MTNSIVEASRMFARTPVFGIVGAGSTSHIGIGFISIYYTVYYYYWYTIVSFIFHCSHIACEKNHQQTT